MSALVNDKSTCELLLNRAITDIDSDIQDELTDGHIFKFLFVPGVLEDEKVYIAFDLKGRKIGSTNLYKNMTLYFFIFSHPNIIKTISGNLRTDLIDERVQYLFNANTDFGIGKMVCTDDDIFKGGNQYYGRTLTFETMDLNAANGGR